jgi:hypothetical protein
MHTYPHIIHRTLPTAQPQREPCYTEEPALLWSYTQQWVKISACVCIVYMCGAYVRMNAHTNIDTCILSYSHNLLFETCSIMHTRIHTLIQPINIHTISLYYLHTRTHTHTYHTHTHIHTQHTHTQGCDPSSRGTCRLHYEHVPPVSPFQCYVG